MPSNITKFGSLKGSDDHKETNKGRFGLVTTELHSVPPAPIGEHLYYIPGSYTWVAPAGATTVSVVCVGGGGGGLQHDFFGLMFSTVSGGGATLAYKNNFSVVPGQGYDLFVGAGGAGSVVPSGNFPSSSGNAGQDSWFNNTSTCKAGAGDAPYTIFAAVAQSQSDAPVGDGGGRGGYSNGFNVGHPFDNGVTGGGGAGGYAGDGSGYTNTGPPGTYDGHPSAGSGAGAAGAAGAFIGNPVANGGPGGGVGVYGLGTSGASHGESGSYGMNAGVATPPGSHVNKAIYNPASVSGWNNTAPPAGGSGAAPHNNADAVKPGLYGGGGGNTGLASQIQVGPSTYRIYGPVGDGGNGAVRIIWGPGRAFPSSLCDEASSFGNVSEN